MERRWAVLAGGGAAADAAPLDVETSEWTRPVVAFDPVITVVADFADGN